MTQDEKDFFRQLGARIALSRKACGLTQAQLAVMLGISQQQMASFEVGRRKVPVSALAPIAHALTVTIEELVGVPARELKKKRGPASKLQQQFELIGSLPKEQQRFVAQFLEMVLSQGQRPPTQQE